MERTTTQGYYISREGEKAWGKAKMKKMEEKIIGQRRKSEEGRR
jgi:hypothetical protein